MRIRPYRESDLEQVAALWHACRLVTSYNDPADDIAFCRKSGHGEIFVGEDESGRIVASTLAGHDGHRGWLYYVAVDPAQQKSGFGRAILDHAEAWLKAQGVRKVQLLVRESNAGVIAFYEHLGYERSRVAVLQRWLIPPQS